VSKAFGFVLLGGLVLIVLLSLALLTWVWIRSSNEPQKSTSVTPKAGLVVRAEESAVALVDSRLAGTASLLSSTKDNSFAINYQAETIESASSLVALDDDRAVACA
jgi:hypothetical protein